MSRSCIKTQLFTTAGFVAITTIAGAFLLSSTVFADASVVDKVNIVVPSTCTMSGTGMTSHNTDIINGNYQANIGTTTLHVFCNDASGIAIYATGYTGNEIGGTNSNKLVGTSVSSNATIVTGLATTAGNPDVSNWAMKLAITQDSGNTTGTNAFTIDSDTEGTFSNFHTVPNEYTKVAHKNAATDMTAVTGGVKLTTTYAAYISRNQPADTYTGQVKYTLVHPSSAAAPMVPLKSTDCPANSICYAPNANDIIGDMSSLGSITASVTAGKQTTVDSNSGATISSSTTSIGLIAPNYAREGYGFAGWSTDFEADNSSTIYGPNETITIEAGSLSPNGMILYPVWIASAGDMQEWTGCSGLTAATYDSTTGKVSATLSQLTALTDTRDGNVYTVAKLVDGKCWMVENLRLNDEHTTSATDIAKAQGYGLSETYGNFIGLASSEDSDFTGTAPTVANNNTNTIYSSDNSTTIDINSSRSPGNRIPRYNNNNTNMSANATNSAGTVLIDDHMNGNNHVRWYSYGNYYNWAAAMASTKFYYYFYDTDNTEQNNSDAAGTSICPKGWELPLGYQSNGADRVGSFSYLDMRMGGTGQQQDNSTTPTGIVQVIKWCSFPNNFVYSGIFKGFRGNYGYYWSRSVYGGGSAYILRIEGYFFDPGSNTRDKYPGRTVRCIAQ